MGQNTSCDHGTEHQYRQPDDPVPRQFKDTCLQIRLVTGEHSCHLLNILGSLLFHDIHHVIDCNDSYQTILVIHYRQTHQVILVEQIHNFFLIFCSHRLDHIFIHNVLNLHIIRIHQKILDRHHAFQPSLGVRDKTGINGLLIHTMSTNIGKCLLHIHVFFQADILCRHNTSSTVLRVFQELVDQ